MGAADPIIPTIASSCRDTPKPEQQGNRSRIWVYPENSDKAIAPLGEIMPRKRKIPVCPGQLSLFDLPVERFATDIFGSPPPHLATSQPPLPTASLEALISNEGNARVTSQLEPTTWVNWQAKPLPRKHTNRCWGTRTLRYLLKAQKLWQSRFHFCKTCQNVPNALPEAVETSPVRVVSGERSP